MSRIAAGQGGKQLQHTGFANICHLPAAEATHQHIGVDRLLRLDEARQVVDGGAGDDVLTGGRGVDRLTGGPGADHFVFTTPGRDRITDFQEDIDFIDLADIDANVNYSGNQAFRFVGGAALDVAYVAASVAELAVDQGSDTVRPMVSIRRSLSFSAV